MSENTNTTNTDVINDNDSKLKLDQQESTPQPSRFHQRCQTEVQTLNTEEEDSSPSRNDHEAFHRPNRSVTYQPQGFEDAMNNAGFFPRRSYEKRFTERFKDAHELFNYDDIHQRVIEDAFILNRDGNNTPTYRHVRERSKKRSTLSEQSQKILETKLEEARTPKRLADTPLFSMIREFWGSGSNKELTPEEKQKLLFRIDDVVGFKVNLEAPIKEKLDTDNKIIKRHLGLDDDLLQRDSKPNCEAMRVEFNKKNYIIQPTYMKDSGSMCFTELWSSKMKKFFNHEMGDQIKTLKVVKAKQEEWESLYRPDRTKILVPAATKTNGFGKRSNKSEFTRSALLGASDAFSIADRLASPKKHILVPKVKLSENIKENLKKILGGSHYSSVDESEKTSHRENITMNTSTYEQQNSTMRSSPVFLRESYSPHNRKKSLFSMTRTGSMVSESIGQLLKSDVVDESSILLQNGSPKAGKRNTLNWNVDSINEGVDGEGDSKRRTVLNNRRSSMKAQNNKIFFPRLKKNKPSLAEKSTMDSKGTR